MDLISPFSTPRGCFENAALSVCCPFRTVTAKLVAKMIGVRAEDFEIIRRVVLAIGVDVMNNFLRAEKTPQLFLHHETMLTNVSGRICSGMIRKAD